MESRSVSGDFTVEHAGPPQAMQARPELCVIELSPTFVFTGELAGSFSSSFVVEHAGPCDQPAPETFSASGTWRGTVLGAKGSFEFEFRGTVDDEGIATGELAIREGSGTDALAGIRGTLTLTGRAGVDGRYFGALQL